MADPKYQTLYQRAYRKTKRQVTLTLTINEAQPWIERASANKQTVAREIFAAAEAYRFGERVPSTEDERELRELIRITRGIANNWNQIARNSNRFAKLLEERRARQLLHLFENTAANFIRRHTQDNEQEHGRD